MCWHWVSPSLSFIIIPHTAHLKSKGILIKGMKAHVECVCKDPHIHSHNTRKRQGGSPMLGHHGTHLQEAEWTLGPVWTRRREEKFSPLRHPGLNPGHSAHSQASFRLRYLAHTYSTLTHNSYTYSHPRHTSLSTQIQIHITHVIWSATEVCK